MDRVSADLLEVGASRNGYRYILVIIDHLTRFTQLVPLKTKDAATVTRGLFNDWFALFGPARQLQTDGGAEFTNTLFKEVCQRLQIKTNLTTAYHPQANGMVERTNRVVKAALGALVDQDPQGWDEVLPYVKLSLNSAFHRSVGETPLFLLTGQEAHFPIGATNIRTTDPESRFQQTVRKARAVAVETTRRARERWGKDYNKAAKPLKPYAVSDLVLWRDRVTRYGDKQLLNQRWAGPGRITRLKGKLVCAVRPTAPPYKEKLYHVNDLKLYYPPEEVCFPPVSDDWDADYVDPLLDDDAEPGDPRLSMAMASVITEVNDCCGMSDDSSTSDLGDMDDGTEFWWEEEKNPEAGSVVTDPPFTGHMPFVTQEFDSQDSSPADYFWDYEEAGGFV